MVRTPGLEPGRSEARDFKSLVSTNSTMPASFIVLSIHGTRTRIRTEISQLSVATEYKPAVLPLNYGGDIYDAKIFRTIDEVIDTNDLFV